MVGDAVTFNEAERRCNARGGHIAVASTSSEEDALAGFMQSLKLRQVWHGAFQSLQELRHGPGVFSSGELPRETAVSHGGPPLQCEVLYGERLSNRIGAQPCALIRLPVICERYLDAYCGPGWTYFDGYCWRRSPSRAGTQLTGLQALGKCMALGATLASPSNEKQLSFVGQAFTHVGVAGIYLGRGTAFDEAANDTPTDTWLDGGEYEPDIASSMHTDSLRDPGDQDILVLYPDQAVGDVIFGYTNAAAPHAFDAVCQRPAHMHTFQLCPQGWLPLGDRCIMFSTADVQWSWSGAELPVKLPPVDAQAACRAAGGSGLFIPVLGQVLGLDGSPFPQGSLFWSGVSTLRRDASWAGVQSGHWTQDGSVVLQPSFAADDGDNDPRKLLSPSLQCSVLELGNDGLTLQARQCSDPQPQALCEWLAVPKCPYGWHLVAGLCLRFSQEVLHGDAGPVCQELGGDVLGQMTPELAFGVKKLLAKQENPNEDEAWVGLQNGAHGDSPWVWEGLVQYSGGPDSVAFQAGLGQESSRTHNFGTLANHKAL